MRKLLPLLLLPILGVLLPFVLAGPGTVPLLAKYDGGPVTGGGAIRGTVTIDPVPAAEAFVINKDENVCAGAKQSPRLVVDPGTKGVANVVVYLDGIERGKPLAADVKAVIDQKECQYTPHITVVPVKSEVLFGSSDPILHNVHVFEGTPENPHAQSKDVFNQAMKDQNVPQLPLGARATRRPGFFFVRCDAGHTWMSAYIWIVEHPYYAVTDAQGRFELTDVPAGEYTLRFWHENWEATPVKGADGSVSGYTYGAPILHAAKVKVAAGAPATADWVIPGG